ncbi:MAG: hypothetical protein ACREAC_19235, partial [Blastocatellia bacterium]
MNKRGLRITFFACIVLLGFNFVNYPMMLSSNAGAASGPRRNAVFSGFTSVSGFSVCLEDDSSGNLLQFDSTTGAYQFTRCNDGFVLTGKGTVRLVNSVLALTDSKPDRRISASFLTNQLTGHATITIVLSGGTYQTISI